MYISYVCTQLEDETSQNIKGHVSFISKSTSATAKFKVYMYVNTYSLTIFTRR